uniref:(northern house mosquito) hypothetical protein n=1 Tax=Culex pipiens TaxID=7175 RepID=A0A8D8H4H2_CULPI
MCCELTSVTPGSIFAKAVQGNDALYQSLVPERSRRDCGGSMSGIIIPFRCDHRLRSDAIRWKLTALWTCARKRTRYSCCWGSYYFIDRFRSFLHARNCSSY